MQGKLIREWKKVFESDLGYVSYELKELVDEPAMVILKGDIGAGKTTFAKNFIQDGETLSPSYSVLSESETVVHADLYRLKGPEELTHLELSLYLDSKQFFLVEWGEKYFKHLARELPEEFNCYILSLSVNENAVAENPDKVVFSRNFSLHEMLDE